MIGKPEFLQNRQLWDATLVTDQESGHADFGHIIGYESGASHLDSATLSATTFTQGLNTHTVNKITYDSVNTAISMAINPPLNGFADFVVLVDDTHLLPLWEGEYSVAFDDTLNVTWHDVTFTWTAASRSTSRSSTPTRPTRSGPVR